MLSIWNLIRLSGKFIKILILVGGAWFVFTVLESKFGVSNPLRTVATKVVYGLKSTFHFVTSYIPKNK